VNVPGKSPSHRRVVVIAGAFVLLASAMTPASAAGPQAKAGPAKKRPPRVSPHGGSSSGPFSLEWAITAALRP
jgi:hypothetical protein